MYRIPYMYCMQYTHVLNRIGLQSVGVLLLAYQLCVQTCTCMRYLLYMYMYMHVYMYMYYMYM